MAQKTVVVTGASGLLGRAVVQKFQAKGDKVIKLAFSRATDGYTKLDLMDRSEVEAFFKDNKVDAVMHSTSTSTGSLVDRREKQADDRGAAERRPDVAEADPEKAERINAAVPAHLAELSKQYGFVLIYISTDYVFNGRNPPYETDAQPDPLQMYGRQKLSGEKEILKAKEAGANAHILRIPILYGKTEYNAESAVNLLQDVVEDQSGKEYKMDHYQVRFPTNVEDVGRVLVDLTHHTTPLPTIMHYTSPAPALTKYDMTRIIATALGLPYSHVIPDANKPEVKPGQTERPENTQLSTRSLQDVGIDTREDEAFEGWWKKWAEVVPRKQQ